MNVSTVFLTCVLHLCCCARPALVRVGRVECSVGGDVLQWTHAAQPAAAVLPGMMPHIPAVHMIASCAHVHRCCLLEQASKASAEGSDWAGLAWATAMVLSALLSAILRYIIASVVAVSWIDARVQ